MNYKIGLLLAFLSAGSAFSDAVPVLNNLSHIKQVVYAFDFDGVIIEFNVAYWLQLAKEYYQHALPLFCNRFFIRDVLAAWSARGLYDEADNKIVGGYQTVDYLIKKYMPWATEADRIRISSAITAVLPKDHMIDYVTSLQVPYVVWTNNDQVTYNLKVQAINSMREEAGKALFSPLSVHTVIPTGLPGATDKSNTKPHAEYYQRVYTETCTTLGLQHGELLVIFVDDKKENVIGAQQAAELYNLPIKAYHHWRLWGTGARLQKLIINDTSWFGMCLKAING